MISECDLFIIHKLADGSWRMEHRTETAVYPAYECSTARKLLSRMAQLLETGPIGPQIEPEHVEITV